MARDGWSHRRLQFLVPSRGGPRVTEAIEVPPELDHNLASIDERAFRGLHIWTIRNISN
jgi:hypothetical protein